MRVIVLTNMYPTPTRPSYGIFVREQIEDLRRLGVDIRVVAFDGSDDRRKYLRAAVRLRRLASTVDADLVHAHYGLTGAVALAQRRLPVVTTFHGSDASGHLGWQARVSWLVARRSTPVFVAAHLATRLGVPDAAVIPAAVDTDLFVPANRNNARRRLGWAPDRRYALLPGARGNPVKRADLFDAAVTEAGRAVPGLVGVSLEGFTRAEVADVMNAVDVCVLTSDYEGSPVTVRESLACNTPVVSVPVGDLPALLADLPGCAVAQRDAAAIGRGIVAALHSDRAPELRARAELDSRSLIAARMLAIYEPGSPSMTSDRRRGHLLMIVHSTVPGDPRVMAEAGAARDAGFNVDILALRGAGEAPDERLADGIRAVRLPVDHRRGAGFLEVVREYLSFTGRATLWAARLARAKRYDVAQVHNPPDFLIVAGIVPKILGARLLFDVHDLAPDMFHSRYGTRRGVRRVDQLLRFVERRALSLADDVLTVHEPYREELIARGARPDGVTVVMNSIATELLPPAVERAARGDRFRVVYHGTITPHYGVELLVRAVARTREQVPDIELDVFGSGDAREVSLRVAAELGIEERARFVDTLSRRDVLAAVNGASVGVVPNLPTRLNRFALSTKLFEYVALGIPAVVADLPTLRMHFSDDEVLFFRAGDELDLSRALVAVARDPDAAATRAQAASLRADAYSWERNAERYVDVLNRGAEGGSAATSRATT